MVQQFARGGFERVAAFAGGSADRFAAEYSIWIARCSLAGRRDPGFHACRCEYNHLGRGISIGFITRDRNRLHRHIAEPDYINSVAGAFRRVEMKISKALVFFVVMAASILYNAPRAEA